MPKTPLLILLDDEHEIWHDLDVPTGQTPPPQKSATKPNVRENEPTEAEIRQRQSQELQQRREAMILRLAMKLQTGLVDEDDETGGQPMPERMPVSSAKTNESFKPIVRPMASASRTMVPTQPYKAPAPDPDTSTSHTRLRNRGNGIWEMEESCSQTKAKSEETKPGGLRKLLSFWKR